MKTDQTQDLQNRLPPPWRACPDFESGCVGWRMEVGQGYLFALWRWIETLSKEARQR